MQLAHRKGDDLDAWYREVLAAADLASPSPVKGCSVLKGYSIALWDRIRAFLDDHLTEAGFSTAYFPLFIPSDDMEKHPEHFGPFSREMLSLQGGDQRLFIRPTSEMIIYPSIRSWIETAADLPLKINQYCSVVRWEREKPNLPLIRDNEFLWQESHSLHASEEEARREADAMLNVYRQLIEDVLAIPTFAGLKPPHRMFAGAVHTLALESIMPNMKAVQMATSHFLGQNFSRPLGIAYQDGRSREYAWQACNGVTTRLIGAMAMVHGDDQGLVIPPAAAPVQVAVEGDLGRLGEELKASHVRIGRVKNPVVKGVPLVARQGSSGLILQRRDTLEKRRIPRPDAIQTIQDILRDIQRSVTERAGRIRQRMVCPDTYKLFLSVANQRSGFLQAGWCGQVECAKGIKKETGSSLRVTSPAAEGTCIRCGKQAAYSGIFAAAY